MIRRLRQRHRAIFVSLALVLPPLFVAGLLSREPIPRQAAGPATPAHRAADLSRGAWSTSVQSEDGDFRLQLVVVPAPVTDSGFAVACDFRPRLQQPDLLAYWSPDEAAADWQATAWFLGPVVESTPAELPLPRQAVDSRGSFVLYSLAKDSTIAVVALPALGTLDRAGAP